MSKIALSDKEIKNPQETFTEESHELMQTVRHHQFRRFIVLSRSRTGSNMLITTLNSHPNILAEGEIFSKLNGKDYSDILATVFAEQPDYVKAKGFKIFYYHPRDDKNSGIWNALESSDDLYVIHLKRENILRTLISRKIAGIQDVWAVKSADQNLMAEKKEITITFTVNELKKGFMQTRRWELSGEKMFRNHPMLSINYEDLVNHREATFHKINEFLGVDYVQPKTMLVKQNTRNMKEMVENYEELKLAFSETEWKTFFED